ncbi:unnamed protein product [Ilex paraguariensis]|uniref:Bulb-type lectin domain-containing protein n=1 Tax=Ilex paraguariensis TaxID=185542 RepID=A0ABC8UYC6_9AQUA
MATKGRMRNLLLLSLSCYCFFISPVYSQTHTIFWGQQMGDREELISENKVFVLKFFSTGTTGSRYLGIFYNTGRPDEKAVWVANRNSPILDASGSLTIDVDGRLTISCSGGINAVLSNSLPANASATLQDSGNFVLSELNSNAGFVAKL